IVRKKARQPFGINSRRQRKDRVHLPLTSTQFLHLSSDEQSAVPNDGFPRQRPSATMHEFTSQRAFIEAARDTVTETDQDAFSYRLIGYIVPVNFETLVLRDPQKLLMQRPNLACSNTVYSRPSQCVDFKVALRRVFPRAYEDLKIRRLLLACA